MSVHDDEVSLRHMLDHAREAVALLQNRSRTDLGTDRLFALLRHLQQSGYGWLRPAGLRVKLAALAPYVPFGLTASRLCPMITSARWMSRGGLVHAT